MLLITKSGLPKSLNKTIKDFVYNKYNCYFVDSNYLLVMLKNGFKFTLLFLLLLLISCAKRGTIDGGVKDTIAPVLKISFPANYSTNFKGNTIKLTFDEYVKLKNINKQLIISPPMSKSPTILPQTASKYITVKFNDSLQALSLIHI